MAVTDHTPSFFSSLDTNILAAVVIIVVGAVATAAGAGGGALFVPLFSSFLHFSVKDATALSQAVITGGAVAGTSFALFRKHPTKPDCPLIQFDLALVLIPSLLLGTSIGVLLNQIFPVWLITLLLIVILTYLTYKTSIKGCRLWRLEQQGATSRRADAVRLQEVQVHQEPDHAHSIAVHNLLRSISEEPISPQHSFPANSATLQLQSKANHGMPTKANPPPVSLAELKLQQLLSMDSNSSANSAKIATSSSAQDIELTAMADSQHWDASDGSNDSAQPAAALGDSLEKDIDEADDEGAMPLLRQPGSQDASENSSSSPACDQSQLPPPAGFSQLDALSILPWQKLMAAVALWVVFASLQLLKAATARCSSMYWLLYSAQGGAAVFASAYFIRAACRGSDTINPSPKRQYDAVSQASKQQVVLHGQSEWSYKVLTVASVIAVGGGAMAGTVGMGGGVVMGPLLLYLQVPPAASAATSTLMILFSSSAATISFGVDGHINAQYALIYSFLNFMSSFVGVFLLGRAIKRTGRSSIIVLLLALMMATGALISAVFGGIESVHDIQNGRNLAFSSFCS